MLLRSEGSGWNTHMTHYTQYGDKYLQRPITTIVYYYRNISHIQEVGIGMAETFELHQLLNKKKKKFQNKRLITGILLPLQERLIVKKTCFYFMEGYTKNPLIKWRGDILFYMNPKRYQHSLMEGSLFLAYSAFPDSTFRGRRFRARLSGSTAAFLSMWMLIFLGPELLRGVCIKWRIIVQAS